MTTRVPGGGVTRTPYGSSWVQGQETPDSVGEQVQDTLFGRRKPDVLPEDSESAALMARLHVYRKKLARLAGDAPEDYDLTLSAGLIASIDASGLIYVGAEFLFGYADRLEAQVGVVAHEIGHRPKRWAEYRQETARSRSEVEDLCRLEETRADYFAGYALAQLEMSAEPLCDFLESIEVRPHPEYFSVPLRRKTILEGHASGGRRKENLAKFFPELARVSSATGDLGQG